MTPADIPQVGRSFMKIFRGRDVMPADGFDAYVRDLLFTSPFYDEDIGSLVYERPDGRIDSALLCVPIRFVVPDGALTGRMLCAFMTEPGSHSPGAAQITLSIRPKRQEFCFSDSASPTSRSHFDAIGATNMPLQALEWRRTFRPLGALARRLGCRWPALEAAPIAAALAPVDRLVRSLRGGFRAPDVEGVRDAEMPLDQFYQSAPGFVAHYAVRPEWSRPELEWLVGMAARNTSFGPLRIRAVFDREDRIIGCFVYYGGAGRVAQVLNVLALQGSETDVIGRMFLHLDEIGCAGAVGRAQPALMDGLARQRWLTFRHKAAVCFCTKHADLLEAARRGDIYLGGLAGESWSRLMSDFH